MRSLYIFRMLGSNALGSNALDEALHFHLGASCSKETPPLLREAIHYAVFPGGGRVRAKLALAVHRSIAGRCGEDALAIACALEFLHSASLVHDDLPMFDNADTRRGRPSVHRVYGQAIALLSGDALIVAAFDTLSRIKSPRLGELIGRFALAAGASRGIVAGQAWESEPDLHLEVYHSQKTGALFEAACELGALSAGSGGVTPWRQVGRLLGRAYQLADDLADALGSEAELGKPVGQDRCHARPSGVKVLEPEALVTAFSSLIEQSIAALPAEVVGGELEPLIRSIAGRLLPTMSCEKNRAKDKIVAEPVFRLAAT